MTKGELVKILEKTNAEINSLHNRLDRLEKGSSSAHLPNTLPNTMILSHTFYKRAFAIYGHVLAVGILIAIPFYCIVFIAALLGGN